VARQAFNRVVHQLTANRNGEADEVFAYLPRAVANGLVRTLEEEGEAFRYDATTQRAYLFQRHETAIDVWTWDHVRSEAEYRELVALLERLELPLDEKQAQAAYQNAIKSRQGLGYSNVQGRPRT
jgi:hypothetical protein